MKYVKQSLLLATLYKDIKCNTTEKQDNSMPRGMLNTVRMYVVIHVLLPIVRVCGFTH